MGRYCILGFLVYFLFFHVFLRFFSNFFIRTWKSRKYFILTVMESLYNYLSYYLKTRCKIILQKKSFVLHKWLKKPEKKCVLMKKGSTMDFFWNTVSPQYPVVKKKNSHIGFCRPTLAAVPPLSEYAGRYYTYCNLKNHNPDAFLRKRIARNWFMCILDVS